MSKPSEVVILAEDQRQQSLVRRYLLRCGYEYHQIRLEPLPTGKGSGEQWVREQYSAQVKAFRNRSARAKTGLIVAIDADTGTVAERQRQLLKALEQATLRGRQDDEAIVHLIPKRNVETWILCLRGTDVDEIMDYRHSIGSDPLVKTAAATLFHWSRNRPATSIASVPSLVIAIQELQRLESS